MTHCLIVLTASISDKLFFFFCTHTLARHARLSRELHCTFITMWRVITPPWAPITITRNTTPMCRADQEARRSRGAGLSRHVWEGPYLVVRSILRHDSFEQHPSGLTHPTQRQGQTLWSSRGYVLSWCVERMVNWSKPTGLVDQSSLPALH